MSVVKRIDELDDDYILKDGDRIRVPMMLSDSGPAIDPAVYRAFYDNLKGNTVVAADHRPRSGVYTADQQKAREERQQRYDDRISRAWRGDSAPADDDEQFLSIEERYRRRDERISSAWKTGNEPVKDDQSKLTVMMGAMATGVTEAGFKAGAAVMETTDLAAARSRYHARLEAGWKEGNQ
jgi:hypothetical protein